MDTLPSPSSCTVRNMMLVQGMVDSWSAGRRRAARRQLSSLRGSEELDSEHQPTHGYQDRSREAFLSCHHDESRDDTDGIDSVIKISDRRPQE